MAKGQLPNIIFVSPTGKGKDKIQHMHTVFEIIEFEADGWPRMLRLMRDDEVYDLQEAADKGKSPAFLTAYVQRRSLAPWKNATKQER